jgi:tetraacyldisaccharide 4'-kinase
VKPARALTAMWYGSGRSRWHPRSWVRATLSTALLPLAAVFGAAVRVRRGRYAAIPAGGKLPVPVVVVGNLTVGGAGKTPLVIALVDALRAAGYRPGVVSRGHGGSDVRSADAIAAVDAADPEAASRFGDEPVLLALRTGVPVFVGKRRPDVARALLAAHPEVDVILSDDGLQHYALARNFEIAVFDARGAGNGRMLPAGPLREPLSRVAGVDAVVLNSNPTAPIPKSIAKSAQSPYRMELVPGDAYRLDDPATTRPLDGFRGRRITAAAGIGNPERFFAMLRGVGLSFHRMPLDDHYRYRTNPFDKRNSEAILVTEKDAVKCGRFAESRLWAVPISARIDATLVDAILKHIGGRKTS